MPSSSSDAFDPQVHAEFLEQARQRFDAAMQADAQENSQNTNLWHKFKDWLLTSDVEEEAVAARTKLAEREQLIRASLPAWVDNHITTLLKQEGVSAQPLLDLQARLNQSVTDRGLVGDALHKVSSLSQSLEAAAEQCSNTTNAIAFDSSSKVKLMSSLSKGKSQKALAAAATLASSASSACEQSANLAFKNPDSALATVRATRFDSGDIHMDLVDLFQANQDLLKSAEALGPVLTELKASHAAISASTQALQEEFTPQAAPYRAQALAMVPSAVLELLPAAPASEPGIELPSLLTARAARQAARSEPVVPSPTVAGRFVPGRSTTFS